MPIGLMRIRHTSLSEFRLYCKYLKLWFLINLVDAFLIFLCTIVMAVLKDELFLLCHVVANDVAYNSCLLCFLKCILIIIVRRV